MLRVALPYKMDKWASTYGGLRVMWNWVNMVMWSSCRWRIHHLLVGWWRLVLVNCETYTILCYYSLSDIVMITKLLYWLYDFRLVYADLLLLLLLSPNYPKTIKYKPKVVTYMKVSHGQTYHKKHTQIKMTTYITTRQYTKHLRIDTNYSYEKLCSI